MRAEMFSRQHEGSSGAEVVDGGGKVISRFVKGERVALEVPAA